MPSRDRTIAMPEFVAIIALMMALSALSIDVMLPALPAISDHYALPGMNDRQLVVTAYLVGFGLGQPVHGPLSDRFGRKPVLLAGMLLFAVGSGLAVFAPEYWLLLLARALQGFGGAAARVLAIAVVRDRFAGPAMARVMSLIMMVFIMVPIAGPALGALILMVQGWHSIFGLLMATGLLVAVWMLLRLPETRSVADRMPLSLGQLGRTIAMVAGTRTTMGYTLAIGFLFAIVMTYIATAQQMFVDIYGLEDLFPLMFGGLAMAVAAASVVNAWLVARLGMRRLSHLALLALVALSTLMALAGFPEKPPLPVLLAYLAAAFFCFGLAMPTFNALAMEPLGHVAGTAASFVGFLTTVMGAFGGWVIGQSFDDTVRPLSVGFLVLSLSALAVVLVTERGRLMQPGHTPLPATDDGGSEGTRQGTSD